MLMYIKDYHQLFSTMSFKMKNNINLKINLYLKENWQKSIFSTIGKKVWWGSSILCTHLPLSVSACLYKEKEKKESQNCCCCVLQMCDESNSRHSWITVPCSQEAARLIFSLTQDSVEVKSSTDEMPTIPFFGEIPVTPPPFHKAPPQRIIGSPDDITSPKLEEELPLDLLLKWADKQKQKQNIISLSRHKGRVLSKALHLLLHAIKTSF